MANVFLEPSTRTASSFNAAFCRLGGKVITIQEGTSSTKKGETLQDTMRCVECYSDVLVLRHPETGAAKVAAQVVKKPCRVFNAVSPVVINAGDGAGEHPTQALLDMYILLICDSGPGSPSTTNWAIWTPSR